MIKGWSFLILTLIIPVFWIYKVYSSLNKPEPVPQSKIPTNELSTVQVLGKKLFFDPQLSNPEGRACSSCHSPGSGFADPENVSFSRGSIATNFGKRNAPSVSYSVYAPAFHYDSTEEAYFGGLFWDGRAKDLLAQVQEPLLNHLEMNNTDKKMLVEKARNTSYQKILRETFGDKFFKDEAYAFESIVTAIEAYERSKEVNPFSSKYDYYLQGKAKLNAIEILGMQVFNDPKKGNCSACHPSEPDKNGSLPLFTDFSYDNLGLPKKNKMASLGPDFGLGQTVSKQAENGKFKVPTLRNVALTAPYFHNGSFSKLEDVVRFYNERDLGKFGKPEVEGTVNKEELGNLKLTEREINALVAFMKTLTDGYEVNKEIAHAR